MAGPLQLPAGERVPPRCARTNAISMLESFSFIFQLMCCATSCAHRPACKYVYVALPCRMPTQLDLLDSPRQCEISLHWLGTVHRFPTRTACKYAWNSPAYAKWSSSDIGSGMVLWCSGWLLMRTRGIRQKQLLLIAVRAPSSAWSSIDALTGSWP